MAHEIVPCEHLLHGIPFSAAVLTSLLAALFAQIILCDGIGCSKEYHMYVCLYAACGVLYNSRNFMVSRRTLALCSFVHIDVHSGRAFVRSSSAYQSPIGMGDAA